MYEIRVVNWDPSSRESYIITSLTDLLYKVGSYSTFDFGEYFYDQFIKHVESYVVKLTISFPFLICGSLSSQKNDIVTGEDEVYVSLGVLNFSYKLDIENMLVTLQYPFLLMLMKMV